MEGREKLPEICREYGIDLVYLFGSQVNAGLELLAGKHVPVNYRTVPRQDFLGDATIAGAAESYLRRSLEAIFDVGRHIIT